MLPPLYDFVIRYSFVRLLSQYVKELWPGLPDFSDQPDTSDVNGFEPFDLPLQLHLKLKELIVEDIGFEPMTPSLQS